ncbi:unnamed protein product [Fusarium langsethiae]|nr:unnamed protein product [Fusarium langsethiae]
MEKVSNEVLGLIIGELFGSQQFDHLRNASLVCRRWNQHAAKYLFGTVRLHLSGGIRAWDRNMGPKVVKSNAQRVIIEVNFCSKCRDMNQHQPGHTRDGEGTSEAPLNAIYKAVKQRDERHLQDGMAGMSHIRELKLNSFCDTHPPEALLAGLFKNVDRLHLEIIGEQGVNWGSAWCSQLKDRDYSGCVLQPKILAPVMGQLVELTFSSVLECGLFPSRFKGNSLMFQNLKTLTLCGFAIGHHDQFEWILNQKTLTCLRLGGCAIVTHFHFRERTIQEWGVDTSD